MRTNMGKHLFLAVVALALCCRCGQAGGQGLPCANTVTADVVAMDQVITYNRYGAVDPDGMIFALMRDVVAEGAGGIAPGNVRLRDGKRPRPLVLRVNQGDCLEVTLTNLLDPTPGLPIATRTVSMHVNGLDYASIDDDASYIGENPSAVQSPGTSTTYTWYAAHQGQFMLHSTTNDAGGEGDSGSQAHGLFGCVNVEPPGSSWYRSQETADRLATTIVGANPNGTPILDYEAIGADGMPILNMLSPAGELIYSDLNAIITGFTEDCTNTPPSGICGKPFREFTVIFHDEIAIQQAFPILKDDVIYHGVRDGFAINYGSGALGAMLVANRLGIGPAADCGECKFEEFFLTSWTQGDPAMPVETDPVTGVAVGVPFPDDPSNVHHSYLGDPVIFRNLHVGKESHVFHLHGHQWLFTPRDENSVYLDSQSISPGSAYTYEINYGGSGNRNLAAGDHIFHCHLYPHFAQGMWELWRAHDVFEMGTPDRSLPDGEILAGTPTPAVVPIPGMGLPPMPTPDFLGYPFYIEANVGHRPPQPPMDLTRDGGLPRHQMLSTTVIDGTAAIDPHYQTDPIYQRVAASNANPGTLGWARKVISAEMELLPDAGTPAEQAAMAFHEGTHGTGAVPVTTDYGWPAVGYPTYDSSGNPGHFLVNGLPPKPGAPYADPCPPTFVDGNGLERPTPERFYDAAFVQFDMTVNALGHHDRQARIIVLREDVFPTLDGTRPPEPLFFRANSGDCVLFQATNLHPNNLNVDDFQVFTPTDTVGQHIHLVKFDVTSSDGSANGWNYEDGTFSAEEVRERIEANNAYQASIGGTQILEPEVHPFYGPGPSGNGEWIGAQSTIQRWWADPLINNFGTDRTIRTVFSHDHFAPSSIQQHGHYSLLVVEPTDSTWTTSDGLTVLGTRADGGPTSYAANIIAGVNGADSVREYVFETGDFMPVYDLNDLPIAPNLGINTPEAISTGGGSVSVNYRNERLGPRTGTGTEAFAFSSTIHGDPFTPIIKAYPGDPMYIRLDHGAQEVQHSFEIHGARWLREPGVANSGYTNQQQYGISEHFEFEFDMSEGFNPTFGPAGVADHLYGSGTQADLLGGMWGLLRTYEQDQPDLARLPSNPANPARPTHPLASGQCPTAPGSPPIRSFVVQAWLAKDLVGPSGITYSNKWSFHDPNGMVFIQADDLPDFASGQRRLEPLVLRANAGDCIEVTLQNFLPAVMPQDATTTSTRVGLHPQMLAYDVSTADGAGIGMNPDGTIGPGQTTTYAWYAGSIDFDAATGATLWTPIEYGVTNLRDFGDIIGHNSHGAFGTLVVEPEGAQYVHVDTGMPVNSGYEADILDVDGQLLFREFVIQYQDDIVPLTRADGTVMPQETMRNLMGYNYTCEPIWARVGINDPRPWKLLDDHDLTNALSSSEALAGCGNLPCLDPETPTCGAEAGRMVMFRVAQPGGKADPPHAFKVTGHSWQHQPWTDGSTKIGFNPSSYWQGLSDNISTSGHVNMLFEAGGPAQVPGDYVYRSQESFAFSGGCWGIFRVTPHIPVPADPVQSLICAATGNQGAHLSWTNAGAYLGIEIERDGILIASLPGSATDHTDSTASPGQHSYSVVATGADLPSTPVTCSVSIQPAAPLGLSCTAGPGGVELSWTNGDGYDLIRILRNGALLTTLPGPNTSYTDAGAPAGAHSYAIEGETGGVASDPATCSASVAPDPVTGLACGVTPGGVYLSWINGYAYDSISLLRNGALLATLPGTATSYSDAGAPVGTHGYTVEGVAGGIPSAAASCSASVAPDPVTGLACAATTGAGISLTWANAGAYSSIDIERDGALIASLPGSATQYDDSAAFPGTHAYTVTAVEQGLSSAPATCAASLAPVAPAGLACGGTPGGVDLTWINGDAYDSIDVLRNGALLATLAGTATSYTDAGAPVGNHSYTVEGVAGGIPSAAASCSASVAPDPVTGLSCAATTGAGISLTWANAGAYSSIDIERDGALIASLPGSATQYDDSAALPGTHAYTVTAVEQGLSSAPATCAASLAPVAPAGLACGGTPGGVDLTWINGDAYDSIDVLRNGALLATLAGTATSYTDAGAPVGTHGYTVEGVAGDIPSAAASCSASVAPDPVTGLAFSITDPCACEAQLTWSNPVPYDSLQVLMDGVLQGTLPGGSTSALVTLPGIGVGADLCVVGTLNGVDSGASCVAAQCDGVAATAPAGLACSIAPGTFTATLDWTNTSQYSAVRVLLDGVLVATLPGESEAATVDLGGPGQHELCVEATTICGEQSAQACCGVVAGQLFMRGDGNDDSLVDIADVIASLNYLFASEPASCLDAHDSNDDGNVDLGDAVNTLLYLFAEGMSPPPPFGACGVDPTPDSLECDSSLSCAAP